MNIINSLFSAAFIVTLTGLTGIAHAEEEMPKSITLAFQPQESLSTLAPNAEKMADYLTDQIGIEVEVFIPTSYAAVVEAMRANHAQVAYFSARPFTIAQSLANAEALVAEVRKSGKTYYYSQWYVSADSDIKTLADLEGKQVAFTSPSSTSGYLFPYAKLVQEGHVEKGGDVNEFLAGHIFAGGYEQALMALVNGQVEAAAASDYAFGRYLSPEQQKSIRVITKQGPVPSHLVGIRKDVPEELKEKIKWAFITLNEPEYFQVLQDVYGAMAFEVVDDSHVNALRDALEATGIDPVPGESFDNIGGAAKEASEATEPGEASATSQPTSLPATK